MLNPISRRHSLLAIPVSFAAAQQRPTQWFPTEDPALVQEMVTVCHGNAKRVRELLAQNPALVHASIDWGFGDWENALGAASHVGNREIAELLISKGAHPTLFSAAMLGQLEVVEATIKATPGIQRQLGPHGITLLAHARAGGQQATAVLKYLTELGDAGIGFPVQPLSASERESLVGEYTFGPSEKDYWKIDLVKDQLGIFRPGAPARRLLHHEGGMVFYPAGAPWAKIIAQRQGESVSSITLGGIQALRR